MDVIAIGNGSIHPTAEDVASKWTKNIAPILQFAHMKTLSKNKCFLHHPIVAFRKSIICTKGKEEQSVCRGDLGSPLIDAKSQKLVGISSFGSHLNKCNGTPQLFTHAPEYIEWIGKMTGVACKK